MAARAGGGRAERPSSAAYPPVYAHYIDLQQKWVRCAQGETGARQFSRFHLYYLEDPANIPQDAAAEAEMGKSDYLLKLFAKWSASVVTDQASALSVIYEWACFEDWILRYNCSVVTLDVHVCARLLIYLRRADFFRTPSLVFSL